MPKEIIEITTKIDVSKPLSELTDDDMGKIKTVIEQAKAFIQKTTTPPLAETPPEETIKVGDPEIKLTPEGIATLKKVIKIVEDAQEKEPVAFIDSKNKLADVTEEEQEQYNKLVQAILDGKIKLDE